MAQKAIDNLLSRLEFMNKECARAKGEVMTQFNAGVIIGRKQLKKERTALRKRKRE